jgi:hypothetical protein
VIAKATIRQVVAFASALKRESIRGLHFSSSRSNWSRNARKKTRSPADQIEYNGT